MVKGNVDANRRLKMYQDIADYFEKHKTVTEKEISLICMTIELKYGYSEKMAERSIRLLERRGIITKDAFGVYSCPDVNPIRNPDFEFNLTSI